MMTHNNNERLERMAPIDPDAGYRLIRELVRRSERDQALEQWKRIDPVGAQLWEVVCVAARETITHTRAAWTQTDRLPRSREPIIRALPLWRLVNKAQAQQHAAGPALMTLYRALSMQGATIHDIVLLEPEAAKTVAPEMCRILDELEQLLGARPEELAARCPTWTLLE